MIAIQYHAQLGPVLRLFGGLLRRTRNLTPVLEGSVADILRNMVKENFQSSGGLATPNWAPLTPAVAARPRLGVLRVTDRLFRGASERGGENIAVVLSGRTLTYGTTVPYAGPHQYGAPAKNLPQRQPIPDPVPDRIEKKIRSAIRAYVIFGRAGGGGDV